MYILTTLGADSAELAINDDRRVVVFARGESLGGEEREDGLPGD